MNKIDSKRSMDVRDLIEDVAGLVAISLLLTAGLFLPVLS